MINFSDIDEHKDVVQTIYKKIISIKTEYGSVEDPLNIYRTASNERAFVSKIMYIYN